MKKVQEIRLASDGSDIDCVLDEAVKFAESMDLSDRDALRIRLLAEETMSMLRTLTGEMDLTLSFIGDENECILSLETETRMDALKKDSILSVSSTGKNSAAKGIMGKLRDVFETSFMMPTGASLQSCGTPVILLGIPADVPGGYTMDTVYWTLSDYRKNVENTQETEDGAERWDELEKSIVSNIADDVQVGVRGNHVLMNIVYKRGGKQGVTA